MNKEELEQLVNQNKSIQDIATIYNKSKTSIRHWLKKYNLVTNGKAGAKSKLCNETDKICLKCNKLKSLNNFRQRTDRNTVSPYCKLCEAKEVKNTYIRNKKFCVNAFGNKCSKCNQQYNIYQYDFHHVEPEHKDFNISEFRHKKPYKLIEELEKCVLVCHNCHMEIHHEMKQHDGYINKIKGNTDLWNLNKKRKLDIIGRYSCDDCGYDKWIGNLSMIFENKKFMKYNKTHFDDEFILSLKDAKICCRNCLRLNRAV